MGFINITTYKLETVFTFECEVFRGDVIDTRHILYLHTYNTNNNYRQQQKQSFQSDEKKKGFPFMVSEAK